MSLRFRLGYWTIFSGEQPIASFANFQSAWAAIWELSHAPD
jgi:hypothetical protein